MVVKTKMKAGGDKHGQDDGGDDDDDDDDDGGGCGYGADGIVGGRKGPRTEGGIQRTQSFAFAV